VLASVWATDGVVRRTGAVAGMTPPKNKKKFGLASCDFLGLFFHSAAGCVIFFRIVVFCAVKKWHFPTRKKPFRFFAVIF